MERLLHDATSPASRVRSVTLLGTYVPRQCGIATFTRDLRVAIAGRLGSGNASVIAVGDKLAEYEYPREVFCELPQFEPADYDMIADRINDSDSDFFILQHEYGIFGGADGSFVLNLARRLKKPWMCTLHTVLDRPSPGQRAVVTELGQLANRLVVMSRQAEELAQTVYGVAPERVTMIPHGIPDVPFVESDHFKSTLGFGTRPVLLTFGLIGPGKGIEFALRAMKIVAERFPEVLYIIAGATHPNIVRHNGEAYRHSLERLVSELGLNNNVQFQSRYASSSELRNLLGAADICVIPYPHRQQVTSGTLAYAVGFGKAVVSTPFWHAEELLADNCGRLTPFGDENAFAERLIQVVEDRRRRDELRQNAYARGRPMIWDAVAASYLRLGAEIIDEGPRRKRETGAFSTTDFVLPDLKLDHLRRMTDDVGMLQHARFSVPDRSHGYCTDDNSRALIAALRAYRATHDETLVPLIERYLAFVAHAYNPQFGRFRNFMGFDRQWLEETGSEDSHGRALWGLGWAVELAPSQGTKLLATQVFDESLAGIVDAQSPRTWAFSSLGLLRYLRANPGHQPTLNVLRTLAHRLMGIFSIAGNADWPWCEDICTYDNGRICEALIDAGVLLNEPALIEQGLRSLAWLVRVQSTEDGAVRLIGNQGWLPRDGESALYDQQPVEVSAMIDACAAAFRATGADEWRGHAARFFMWFVGNNVRSVVLYDKDTGGCSDGLQATGPSLNQGAESTLAWILSHLSVSDLGLEEAGKVSSQKAHEDSDTVS